jgi:hypothetical protein
VIVALVFLLGVGVGAIGMAIWHESSQLAKWER